MLKFQTPETCFFRYVQKKSNSFPLFIVSCNLDDNGISLRTSLHDCKELLQSL